MQDASEPPVSLAFGRFRVSPHRRELLADGQPIKLGGRAFDVLLALIEARGAVVGKDALMARVWPDRAVEENNLQTQIVALRRAFGAERNLIRTVSGRGYQFTGEIRMLPESPPEHIGAGMTSAGAASALGPTNLPQPVSELIGRDDELREIMSLATAHRLVTLTGLGGIGKTQLALAAARRLLPDFVDGVWVIELAPLADPGLVPARVAAAVGLDLSGAAISPDRVAAALSGKRLLLILDNCEHVIDEAARTADAVLRRSRMAHVVATSREPLRVEGEWVYPVPPLSLPAENTDKQDDPLRYGAILLFVQRARAAEPHFSPDRRRAAMIATACRRLDGIPLAIELAAARAATLGVEALSASLDDRFSVLTGGRRTALPRHQTLRAALDWSYELLSEPERVLLSRLGVFAGSFSLEAACAVATDGDIASADVVEGVASLVAKSLVAVDGESTIARYRMLDTTRAYALEKLVESGERDRLERRHAEYGRDVMERAETRLERSPTARQRADLALLIDNVRANLDWAFSAAGDASLGIAVAAAAIPLWMHLSLMDECRGRVEQALAAIESTGMHDAVREMKLYAALGASLMYTSGDIARLGAAWTKALEIAESIEAPEYQLRSVRGLYMFHAASGRYRAALALAERFYSLAATSPDPNDQLVGERFIGITRHFLGDLLGARRHIKRVLAEYGSPEHRQHILRFQFDQRVTATAIFGHILWLQGFPEQAIRAAEHAVEGARATGHAMSLCYTLALAGCPIALSVGDLAAAEDYIGMLLERSTKLGLVRWHAFGLGHQGTLAIKRGDLNTGLGLLRAGLDEFGETRSAYGYVKFRGTLASALNHAGQVAEGLAVIEEALQQVERTEERWPIAEFLRIKGELVLSQGAPAAAEEHFRQALDWARRQEALSWELRAATSLARLLRDQDRAIDALALLQPLYDRFTEGFETADLKTAKSLIDALQ